MILHVGVRWSICEILRGLRTSLARWLGVAVPADVLGGMIWEGLRCQRGSTAPLLSMGCGTAATSIRRCNICIISGVAEVSSSMRLLRAVRCLVPLFRATIFRATLPSATVLRPETSLRCQGAQTWIQLLCDGNESACEWCRACLLFDSYVIRMYTNFQALSHSAVN